MQKIAISLTIILLTCSNAQAAPSLSPGLVRLRQQASEDRARGLEPIRELSGATIKFTSAPEKGLLERLEQLGVVFFRPEGRILHGGLIYPARIPVDAVDELMKLGGIQEISAQGPAPSPAELNYNGLNAVEAFEARGLLDGEDLPVTGKGVRIGLIDTWMDQLHPSFFHADGGLYSFTDVNGDGLLTPGVDGVDLDQNGTISSGEVLKILKGTAVWPGPDGSTVGYNFNKNEYLPGMDWLYLDSNGSGKREAGVEAGFDEATPAYGEPIFYGDDINGSGLLEQGEKLARLGTSKFEIIYIVGRDETYRRGLNLIEYIPYMDYPASHSSMTIGEIVSGDPRYTLATGLAPDADIVLTVKGNVGSAYFSSAGEMMAACLTFLMDQEVPVVLHEYGLPFDEFLDGSSHLEELIDQASNEHGMMNIIPTHNFAGNNAHAITSVEPGAHVDFPVRTNTDVMYKTFSLTFALRWTAPTDQLSVQLLIPDQGGLETPELGETSSWGEVQGVPYTHTGILTSSRGTRMCTSELGSRSFTSTPLPGDVLYRVTNNSDQAVELDLWIGDQNVYLISGILESYMTKTRTMAWPSTADRAISVGATINADYGHPDQLQGDLAYFSGQGPRLDGLRGLDVVAPSDILAPMVNPSWNYYPAFSYSSGTSGSAPIVTAIAALALQAFPGLTEDEFRQLLAETSIADEFTGDLPNNTWGEGKISAYRVLTGMAPGENQAPIAAVSAASEGEAGAEFELDPSASSDADGDQLMARWDLGYDGEWDLDWDSISPVQILLPETPAAYPVILEVRDQAGATDRVLTIIQVVEGQIIVEEPTLVEDLPWQQDILDLDQLEETLESDTSAPLESDLETGAEVLEDADTADLTEKKKGSGGCSQTQGSPSNLLSILLLLAGLVGLSRRSAAAGRTAGSKMLR